MHEPEVVTLYSVSSTNSSASQTTCGVGVHTIVLQWWVPQIWYLLCMTIPLSLHSSCDPHCFIRCSTPARWDTASYLQVSPASSCSPPSAPMEERGSVSLEQHKSPCFVFGDHSATPHVLEQAAEPCPYRYYNAYKKSKSRTEKSKHLQPWITTLQICIFWCSLGHARAATGVWSPWDGFILACAGSGSPCSQRVRSWGCASNRAGETLAKLPPTSKGVCNLLIKMILIQTNVSLFLIAWSREEKARIQCCSFHCLILNFWCMVGKHLLIANLKVKLFIKYSPQAFVQLN